ncbi:diaminopimelate decarboxylase [Alicyclobacillus hesperidum URH17-3-68]|nr:diaminopimelate decarboxylase [Alicyclobacillus hesperidum URH17-3-68]
MTDRPSLCLYGSTYGKLYFVWCIMCAIFLSDNMWYTVTRGIWV